MEKEVNILVSIIMPVYNSAEYLEQTLRSVLSSGEKNIELIAVDDGSIDDSLLILQKYVHSYDNLIVIEQENAGPAAARNKGLSFAKGEFVFFLDSDDLLEVRVLQEMCKKADEKSADLVIASYDIFNEFRTFSVPSIAKLSSMEIIPWNEKGILWTFSLCNKVFRRNVIEEKNIRFPNTNYSEDGVFVMNFVYHVEKIIGYNDIVFHYRRMTSAVAKSITSSVSESKVIDYLRSHQMIYKMLEDKCLEMNPQYTDFECLREENDEINEYVNEFLKKEINILFNQFYKFFWSLEEKVIQIIVSNLNQLLAKLDVRTYYQISINMPELVIRNLPATHEQAMKMANISVILYSDQFDLSFEECIQSLSLQRYVPYKIIVPALLKKQIEKVVDLKKQIIYIDADNREEFYHKCMEYIESKYVLFADSHFVYDRVALLELYKLSEKMHLDFITSTIYLKNDDLSFPSASQGRALLKIKNFRDGKQALKMDSTLGNKLINTNFVRGLNLEKLGTRSLVKAIYKQGFFAVTEKCYSIFNGNNERELVDYLTKEDIAGISEEKFGEITLHDSRFLVDQIELYKKLRTTTVRRSAWKRELIYKLSQLPVENRVLFFSIRRNGELDDNLKCVADQWDGEKIIAAKMLPHDNLYKLKMYYYIATSKIIITDDYIRYLRLFPLKRNQRVIQLWHACGAFKKFGIQGTTLSLGLERATHIQYNLVSVSAESIRQIYAEAFDIDNSHVVALGVPRTDIFFDEAEANRRRDSIYARHPEWKNKEIILYAPTFRDKTGDRTMFRPEIDFSRLSNNLNKDQIFVIAPHPVMKKNILERKYKNIVEERNIRTLDLMFVSSQLITDYSSVIFEYSLLGKPIAFFCYDLKIYDRGFYLPYDANLPGPILKNQDELEKYLLSDMQSKRTANYEKFVENYMGACDGDSTKRIVDLLKNYMEK